MIPTSVFQSIALCMSGGGYRAASFHLGAMSYLNRISFDEKPLLEHVTAISTVSGGTITGAVYAIYKAKGKTFEEFFNHLIEQLKTRDLIKEGLSKLKLGGQWHNPYKRKNLINAFAEIYNIAFTDNTNFGYLVDHPSHLDLIVFNATEFNHGVNFRFQNQGRMGNNFVQATADFKNELKVSDMIAASSCFPGGFEPIAFPSDFQHEDTPFLNAKISNGKIEEVGLMDGGIYDNQGIDAILLSEERNKKQYDLIIISDVSSPNMNNFSFTEPVSNAGFRKNNIKNLFKSLDKYRKFIGILGAIILLVGIIVSWFAGFQDNAGTGAGIVIGLTGLLICIAYLYLNSKIKSIKIKLGDFIKSLVPGFYYKHISSLDLSDYTIAQYQPLILDRINSLLLLVQDVFLKQIRRLNYAKIYNSKDYECRRISNLSRELTEEQFGRTKKFQSLSACPDEFKNQSYETFLGQQLGPIIKEAADFGTNLWFTEDDELNNMLDKLVISGQASMCFNLMVYVWDIKSHESYGRISESLKTKINEIEVKLVNDWKMFTANPSFMINA